MHCWSCMHSLWNFLYPGHIVGNPSICWYHHTWSNTGEGNSLGTRLGVEVGRREGCLTQVDERTQIDSASWTALLPLGYGYNSYLKQIIFDITEQYKQAGEIVLCNIVVGGSKKWKRGRGVTVPLALNVHLTVLLMMSSRTIRGKFLFL